METPELGVLTWVHGDDQSGECVLRGWRCGGGGGGDVEGVAGQLDDGWVLEAVFVGREVPGEDGGEAVWFVRTTVCKRFLEYDIYICIYMDKKREEE